MSTGSRKTPWQLWLFGGVLAVYLAVLLAPTFIEPGLTLFDRFPLIQAALQHPLALTWTPITLKTILIMLAAYALAVLLFISSRKNTRRGAEHGSAKWTSPKALNRRFEDRSDGDANLLLSDLLRLGFNGRKTKRNLNVCVIGGSGTGKTRFYVMPNGLQAAGNYVILDPKGENLRMLGGLLTEQGYSVRVFDIKTPATSFGYNPFAYLRDDQDAVSLANNLQRAIKPKNSTITDPFWEDSARALLSALILYVMHELPPHEQSWLTVIQLLNLHANNDDDNARSPLDLIFEELEARDPYSFAATLWHAYKHAGTGKTAQSVAVVAAITMAPLAEPVIASMMRTDELALEDLATEKVALFICTNDADPSLNFLANMLYTQLFQRLNACADNAPRGRLPQLVQFLMDEFANIALPLEFEYFLATCRGRNMGVSIILQSLSQLNRLFDKSWQSVLGQCDTVLYLGSNENETNDYISKMLGKETLDTNTYSLQRGARGHYTKSDQQTGRELLTPDELRTLDNDVGICLIRGESPVLDRKYPLTKHPRYNRTGDATGAPYDYAARSEFLLGDLPCYRQRIGPFTLYTA